MTYTEDELRAAGYTDVRVEPTAARFENTASGEVFEPTQIETFRDANEKLCTFYSRPGEADDSRHSLESLRSDFRELTATAAT